MGKAKNDKLEPLSDFEEMLMWTSYRYCIGRHTYVTCMAGDIARHYFNRLSDAQRERTALDIRRSIAECMRFGWPCISFDWSIPEKDRRPVESLMEWMIQNGVSGKDDVQGIEKVEAYRDRESDDPVKLRYRVTRTEPADDRYVSDNTFFDLIPWMELANAMDKSCHKIAVVEYNGETTENEVFETYAEASEPIEGQPGYYRRVSWKWEKRWVSLEHYLENPSTAGYIVPEYIKEIKDLDYTPEED